MHLKVHPTESLLAGSAVGAASSLRRTLARTTCAHTMGIKWNTFSADCEEQLTLLMWSANKRRRRKDHRLMWTTRISKHSNNLLQMFYEAVNLFNMLGLGTRNDWFFFGHVFGGRQKQAANTSPTYYNKKPGICSRPVALIRIIRMDWWMIIGRFK